MSSAGSFTSPQHASAAHPALRSSVLREIALDIKLAHSVFALPFALLGAFMAAWPIGGFEAVGGSWWRFAGQLGLVVLAMVCARTAAMLANRLLDRHIDARNPRTSDRAIPAGRLPVRAAIVAMLLSTLAFMAVACLFGWLYGNWWPALLALPVLAWLCAYGLMKRMTALCHLWLGASLAMSPAAAALAIDPAALAQPALWLLCVMVLFWVAGFDVIYALQDEAVDRAEGLHSVPASMGTRGAIMVARLMHFAAFIALAAAAWFDPRLGVTFGLGVAIVGGLLVAEHATVVRWGTSRLAIAVFTLNGVVSCIVGGLGIVDILVV